MTTTTSTPSEKFVLYRFFSADGELLYIGKSVNVWNRFRSHRRESAFYPEAATVKLQRGFDNEADLAAAEISAIRAEHPRCNIAHNDTALRNLAAPLPAPSIPAPVIPATIDHPSWQAGVWNRITPRRDLPLLMDEVLRVYEGDTVTAQGVLDDYEFGCTACEEKKGGGFCDFCQSDTGEDLPELPTCFLHMIGEDFRESSRVTGNNFDGASPVTGWFTVAVNCFEDAEESGDPNGIAVYLWVSNDSRDDVTRAAWAAVDKTYHDMERRRDQIAAGLSRLAENAERVGADA